MKLARLRFSDALVFLSLVFLFILGIFYVDEFVTLGYFVGHFAKVKQRIFRNFKRSLLILSY